MCYYVSVRVCMCVLMGLCAFFEEGGGDVCVRPGTVIHETSYIKKKRNTRCHETCTGHVFIPFL